MRRRRGKEGAAKRAAAEVKPEGDLAAPHWRSSASNVAIVVMPDATLEAS